MREPSSRTRGASRRAPSSHDHPVNRAREQRGRPPGNIVLVRDAGNTCRASSRCSTGSACGSRASRRCRSRSASRRSRAWTPILVTSPTDPAGYSKLAERAIEALDDYDALYVHLKGPDVPAHDGRAFDKRDVIADIDEGYFGTLLPEIGRSRRPRRHRRPLDVLRPQGPHGRSGPAGRLRGRTSRPTAHARTPSWTPHGRRSDT